MAAKRRTVNIRGREYPVLLPSIRDPRLHVAVVLLTLQGLGQTVLNFRLSIAQILICLATGSNVPVLFGRWLVPGQHVTSIVASNKGVLLQGSVSQPRREFDDAVIARADRVVATLKEQAIMDEQADLFEPVEKGIISWDRIADLGELVVGKVAGRRSPQEITVFKQNSDQGVGFMALAKLAHDKARVAGLGIEI